MASVKAGDLRGGWIAKAKDLDSIGHFADYPLRRRQEALQKGFLGEWPPDRALIVARRQVGLGYGVVYTPKFVNEMRDHFGLVGDDIRHALLDILGEVPPESYEPPRQLRDPPGCPG